MILAILVLWNDHWGWVGHSIYAIGTCIWIWAVYVGWRRKEWEMAVSWGTYDNKADRADRYLRIHFRNISNKFSFKKINNSMEDYLNIFCFFNICI